KEVLSRGTQFAPHARPAIVSGAAGSVVVIGGKLRSVVGFAARISWRSARARGGARNDMEATMNLPPVVSPGEWQVARESLLVKEKEATRARDALAAERRRMPVVLIDKDYVFEGPDGGASLVDLFDERRQLIIYHFMFAPGVEG